jgi:hypothetical protein
MPNEAVERALARFRAAGVAFAPRYAAQSDLTFFQEEARRVV